ncbi:MAG TPA: hypothetical protein VL977_05460, partial [Solirubrobacteraceae bacterium]|nr:hypothetical protein [Solirubrobacteraceae bacterium]
MARGSLPTRRIAVTLAVLAALASAAAGAEASVWGGRPAPGAWHGKTSDGGAVSFNVTAGGRRAGSFSIAVDYSCADGDTGAPLPGGQLILTHPASLAVQPNGYFRT